MAIVTQINSNTVTPKTGTLAIEATLGGRYLCRMTVDDAGGSGYHPNLGENVSVADGGTTHFGGFLTEIDETGYWDAALTAITRSMVATDHRGRCDQRIVNETYTAGQTLKAIYSDLRTKYLNIFGITLATGLAAGPIMPALTWSNKKLTDVLNELQALTVGLGSPYYWTTSYEKVFGMWPVTDLDAPWDISAGNPRVERLSWSKSTADYRNRQFLLAGSAGSVTFPVTHWDGDGVKTVFPFFFKGRGFGIPAVVSVRRGGGSWTDYNVGWYDDPAYEWQYDNRSGKNEIIQNGGTVLGVTDDMQCQQTVDWPQTFQDETGAAATNPWEAVDSAPDTYDKDTLVTTLDAQLNRFGSSPKTVSYTTLQGGLVPGQNQDITVPSRHVSGSFLITSVRATHADNTKDTLIYEVEAIEGSTLQKTFLDTYRQWSGLSGSSIVGSTVIAPSAGTAMLMVPLSSSTTLVGITAAGTLTPVPGAIPWPLSSSKCSALSLRVHAWVSARTSGGTAILRLRNTTDSTNAGSSAGITLATSATEVTFDITLDSGTDTYQLQVECDTIGKYIGVTAILESL